MSCYDRARFELFYVSFMFNFDDCKILGKATYRHRTTLESWHTATTLNSDNNAQHLPEQYRFLLKK